MYKKIGVISDIHSNAISLKIALNELINQKVEVCIVLGDLLTYGTQPNEVIELLLDFKDKIKCIFIKGNHEEFYFNVSNKINSTKYKIPQFVEESIFWTKDKLKYDLYKTFEWHNNFKIDQIYFSHANPFDYPNWTYMNKEEDIKNAAHILNNKNMRIGIFGHTHRNKGYIVNENFNNYKININKEFNLNTKELLILNSGSIGQPRGSDANFIIIDILINKIKYHDIKINLDKKQMINEINRTNLGLETKNKLNTFWEIKND